MALQPIFTDDEQRAVTSLQGRLVEAPWPALGVQAALMAAVRDVLARAKAERYSGPVHVQIQCQNGLPMHVQSLELARGPKVPVKA